MSLFDKNQVYKHNWAIILVGVGHSFNFVSQVFTHAPLDLG